MAQQRYDKGIPFQTSSWAELSGEWKWEGRELTGMYLPLCGEVDVGTWLTLYANETEISGMWKMNMSPDPVKVYLIGDSGEVSVTVIEKNCAYPLGTPVSVNPPNPYEHSTIVTNVIGQSETLSSIYIYRQPEGQDDQSAKGNGNTHVRLLIEKNQNTTITKISWRNTDYIEPDTSKYRVDSGINGLLDKNTGRTYFPVHSNWDSNKCDIDKQYGLSVYFTSQGILTYNSNKNAVNPKLRN